MRDLPWVTAGGIRVKPRPVRVPSSARLTEAMASDRRRPRLISNWTPWSSATASNSAAELRVMATSEWMTAMTTAITSTTPNAMVKTVLSVTWEGLTPGLGSSGRGIARGPDDSAGAVGHRHPSFAAHHHTHDRHAGVAQRCGWIDPPGPTPTRRTGRGASD